jgi:hypothetical protein
VCAGDRLIGSFGERLDDIRIADSSGHEVGFIREESSLLSKVYRMPTYRTSRSLSLSLSLCVWVCVRV